MERNTLLAIALSALVLFSYQAIFVTPKQAELAKNAQIIAPQAVSSVNTTQALAPPIYNEASTSLAKKLNDYEVKTTGTVFSFSNVGGSLHNIDFTGNSSFPVTDVLSLSGLDNAQYSGQKLDDSKVSLVYSDKNWQITKTYDLSKNNLAKVRMEIKNISENSILSAFTFTAFKIDESNIDINQNNRESALYEYSVYADNKIFRKGNASKFNEKNSKNESVKINWIAFRDHYHAIVLKPEFETKSYEIKADNDKQWAYL